MPRKIFVSDLVEGNLVESIFLVKLKSLQHAKNGNPYINVVLTDKTGEVVCRIWENALELETKFKKEDFVYVKGKVTKYQGKNQLNINEIKSVTEDLITLSDFQPTSDKETELLKVELKNIINKIKNVYLKKLLFSIFSDKNISQKYFTAPAAKTIHHSYIGGLLEHSLNLAMVAGAIVPFYPMVNADLVITALLLHDLGKIRELNYKRNFDYTDEGRLIGHIVIGTEIINSHIKKIDGFPETLRLELIHIVLSHHGSLEFGSPKRPKTIEAIMASYIDDMDSKIFGVHQFAKADQCLISENWSSYNKFYDRYFYFPKHEDQKHNPEKTNTSGNLLSNDIKQKLKEQFKTSENDSFIEVEKSDDSKKEAPGDKEQNLFDF